MNNRVRSSTINEAVRLSNTLEDELKARDGLNDRQRLVNILMVDGEKENNKRVNNHKGIKITEFTLNTCQWFNLFLEGFFLLAKSEI